MPNSFQNGDVSLTHATLTSAAAGASISILPQLQGFDIWEDMAKPTLFACLYMYDAIGLLSNFPIVGEEDVSLTFATPGISEPVTYKFKVHKVQNVQQSDNRKVLGYMLKCISAEHFENGAIEIRQSFEGLLSDFAKMVAAQYLSTTKEIVVEETRGVRNIVVPKWSPLEALDYARHFAVSAKFPSSSFVFFENQAGFTFASVEYLIDQQRGDSLRTYNFLKAPNAVSPAASYRSVLEHEALARSDSIDMINSGTLHAETTTFDMLTKQLLTKPFKITTEFPKFTAPDTRSKFPNSSEFIKKYGTESPERFFIVKDSARAANYYEDSLAPRNAYRTLLNGNTTRLLVHGDSGLKAGDMITLELPDTTGTTGRDILDPLLAGNYIILRLRHIVSCGQKPHHEIALDVAKVTFRR